jgi:UDP:flavonoid glycosyltransferase YjiC (YdhE family)
MNDRYSQPGIKGPVRRVAFFCMRETGHFQRLRPLIAGIAECGLDAYVFTDSRFKAQVEDSGGIFVDLFSPYSLESADDRSMPFSSRYVTFAGKYAEHVRRLLETIRPSLIVHESFAVIAQLMADLLGIPRVNVCSGHNTPPAYLLETLAVDRRVNISDECLQAVQVLRNTYGMTDASPFSYVTTLSPHLNIYCEPQEFLEPQERVPFEPIAFYGSLSPANLGQSASRISRSYFDSHLPDILKVYISFGTVIWRNFSTIASNALNTLSAAIGEMDNVQAIISLGGYPMDHQATASLQRPNVRIENYVDQWQMLREVDVFVTHQGMNSTHEAIWHRVPMISYPIFWDQPGLAARCQRFGLAIPLADDTKGEFSKDRVYSCLKRVAVARDSMKAALTRAREWEEGVIASRPSVHRRIVELMS